MTLYRTRDGDMVDAICWHHYGDEAMTAAVCDANPGLATRGPLLPAGIVILLPERAQPALHEPLRLWG